MKTVNILGATGSVGQSTVDVILAHQDKFKVNLISAHKKEKELVEIKEKTVAEKSILTQNGNQGLLAAIEEKEVDITVAAIVGMAGLEPLLKSIPQSKAIAIANKEPLVAAGDLVLQECKKHGTKILPVDSEHNAIFQVFEEHQKNSIERIILTASGGPFRTYSTEQMRDVTPEVAVKHPNWSMGAKISIDSATLMNKALEVIEAHYLFDMPADRIDVLVHPESIIHSMVEYADGSVLAQLGAPDMKTPITYALGWPERISSPGQKLGFSEVTQLNFEQPDLNRFPSLKLAYDCLKEGQAACLALNAANEICVDAFLNKQISFLQIVENNQRVLNDIEQAKLDSLEDILSYDQYVRNFTRSTLV